jgi:hypothetical protein
MGDADRKRGGIKGEEKKGRGERYIFHVLVRYHARIHALEGAHELRVAIE